MKIDIDRLTESELIELNNKVVLRLRFLAQMRTHNAMMKFNIGNRVCFDPADRPTVTGVITKYNKKSVTVITDDGQHWTVAPTLLRKAESDITPTEIEGNVVPMRKP